MKQLTRIVISLGLGSFGLAQAQTQLDLSTQTRRADFSDATSTKPAKVGTTLPSSCTVGEQFFKSDAAPGENLYGCTAANHWTVLTTGSQPYGGDVSGLGSSISVDKIKGQPVNGAAPHPGDILRWDVNQGGWAPSPFTGAYTAGPGITIAGTSISVDDATIPQYQTGASAPTITCLPGRDFYLNTTTGSLYFCKAIDTWQSMTSGGGLSAPTGTGLMVWDGTATNSRSLAGTANRITVTNGNGVSGNVTVDLGPAAVVTSGTYADPAWLTSVGGSKVTGSIPGSAASLSGNGTNCAAGQFPKGIDATGNAEGCAALATSDLPATVVRTDLDTDYALGKRHRFQGNATAPGVSIMPSVLPASPQTGDLVIDSADYKLKWFNGSIWQSGSSSGTAGTTTIGVLMFSAMSGLTASTTTYCGPAGISCSATETQRQLSVPVTGTIRDLYLTLNGNQAATGSMTCTVRRNGADTAIQVVVSASDGSGAQRIDVVNTAAVTAGDKLAIACLNSASSSGAPWNALLRIVQ